MTDKLTREHAAEFLTDNGYPTSRLTLAKYASVGGGPVYSRFGPRVYYTPADLLAWAEAKSTGPVNLASEAKAILESKKHD